jgi:hypothetical protein
MSRISAISPYKVPCKYGNPLKAGRNTVVLATSSFAALRTLLCYVVGEKKTYGNSHSIMTELATHSTPTLCSIK